MIRLLHKASYTGQTFCVRAMITAFMGDAANIMSFYGEVDDSVGYAVELWIFKPQKSGKQVTRINSLAHFTKLFQVWYG